LLYFLPLWANGFSLTRIQLKVHKITPFQHVYSARSIQGSKEVKPFLMLSDLWGVNSTFFLPQMHNNYAFGTAN